MSSLARADVIQVGSGNTSLRRRLDGLVVGLLLVAIAVVAAGLFLITMGLVEPKALIPDASLRQFTLGWLNGSAPWVRLAVAGGSLVSGVLALGAVLSRLRPDGTPPTRRGGDVHVLTSDDRGVVFVARRGIEGVARAGAASAPGVADVDAQVRTRGPHAVALRLHVLALPGVDLKRAGELAQERAADAVQRLVGLEVKDVAVRIEVLPPEELSEGLI